MIDEAAFFAYAKMSAAMWDWCRIAGAIVQKNSVDDLRRLYVAFTAQADHQSDCYIRELAAGEP